MTLSLCQYGATGVGHCSYIDLEPGIRNEPNAVFRNPVARPPDVGDNSTSSGGIAVIRRKHCRSTWNDEVRDVPLSLRPANP